MQATIADVIEQMERIAPSRLAEDWDNVGLQVGRAGWPVKMIWVALDPLPAVVDAACREKVGLLVTHHPLIFRPLRSIDMDTPTGKIIARAVSSRLGIYAAHTNLDSAVGGLNDLLAEKFGVKNPRVLKPSSSGSASPGASAPGQTAATGGLGRVGDLEHPTTLFQLARQVKEKLGLGNVRVAGDPELRVTRVALCTGSGSSLMADFLASGAQVYLSGDLHYHDARSAEEQGRGLIDVGHFASESLMVVDLARRLSDGLGRDGFDVAVTPCGIEEDPFSSLS